MGWIERAFEEQKRRGRLRVSVRVPLGVNPFRDLWDKFFGNKTVEGGNHGKRRGLLEGRNRLSQTKKGER